MPSSRLDQAYTAQIKAVRDRVDSYTKARFLAGEYRDADLERFVEQVLPVALAARKQVSALTDSYLSQTLSAALGRRIRPQGPIDTDALRGVAAAAVYARPIITVRARLSEGLPYPDAVSAGVERLKDIVLSDMQLAKTHTARNVFSETSGFTSYERTLSGNVNCGLCYVASTQRYSKADLMPIHPGCDCGVSAIVDGEQIIHPERLADTHEAISDRLGTSDASGRAPDYRKQLIVREHGELGPVLAVRGQHFAGRSVMDN